MGFESTHMGMKFFNVQVPQLIDSINRVADGLDKINQTSFNQSSKEEHYKELLNSIIGHIFNCEDSFTTIKTLLYWCFTVEDLIQDFGFDESEVKNCEKEMDDFNPIY